MANLPGRRPLYCIITAVFTASTVSCNGDGGTTGLKGSFTGTVGPIELVLGQVTAALYTLNRIAPFTGAVNVSGVDLPTGVTIQPFTIPEGQTSATFNVATSVSASVGTHQLKLKGSGAGVDDVTTSFNLTINPKPAFSLAFVDQSVSVGQTRTQTATVRLTRDIGYMAPITLALGALPAGTSATVTPATLTGALTEATVRFNSGGVAAGNYNLSVVGTGANASETATASAPLNVTATPGTRMEAEFCEDERPVFVGFKNGDNPWTQLVAINLTYAFIAANTLSQLAVVTQENEAFRTRYFVGAISEMLAWIDKLCKDYDPPPIRTFTLNSPGTAANDLNAYLYGRASGFTNIGMGNLQLAVATAVAHDLLALQIQRFLFAGRTIYIPNRMVMLRDFNAANGSSTNIDYMGASSFDHVIMQIAVQNLGVSLATLYLYYLTANGTRGLYYTSGSPWQSPWNAPGVPTAQQRTGDLHRVAAEVVSGEPPITTREVGTYFGAPRNVTMTMAEAVAISTLLRVATAPYVRFALTTPQAALWTTYVHWVLANAAASRFMEVWVTGNTSATVNWEQPDLTSIGFNPFWAMAVETQYLAWIYALGGFPSVQRRGSDGLVYNESFRRQVFNF